MEHSLKLIFTKRSPADNADLRRMKSAVVSEICGKYFQILFSCLFSSLLFFSCENAEQKTEVQKVEEPIRFVKHPEWTKNSTIYEVNLRQYSQSGSFKDFETQLPRLKKMGVDILWLMPIFPIGEKNRKGKLGSYYSVKDYRAVNSEHGTMDDFKSLVKKIHELEMHIILDWVANHCAWDNDLVQQHPDWFTKDSLGNFVPPVPDWHDVVDMNYEKKELWQYMMESMKFWVTECDVDGFRCDVAEMVPVEFWNEARMELDKVKPVFMLAEAEKAEHHEQSFDMSYGWEQHFLTNEIYEGKKSLADLDNYFEKNKKNFSTDAYRMYFTSNHDENSWKGTEYERLGNAVKTFAVLTFTISGMPLIYSGQESALNKRLNFFEKDVIDWKDYPLEKFYTLLCSLKKNNPALWNGNSGGETVKIKTTNDKSIYAFARKKNENEVIVILNLSKEAHRFSFVENTFIGEYTSLFNGAKIKLEKEFGFEMREWEYLVLEKK